MRVPYTLRQVGNNYKSAMQQFEGDNCYWLSYFLQGGYGQNNWNAWFYNYFL